MIYLTKVGNSIYANSLLCYNRVNIKHANMWNVDNNKLNNHLNNKKHQYPGVSGAFEEANIKY